MIQVGTYSLGLGATCMACGTRLRFDQVQADDGFSLGTAGETSLTLLVGCECRDAKGARKHMIIVLDTLAIADGMEASPPIRHLHVLDGGLK